MAGLNARFEVFVGGRAAVDIGLCRALGAGVNVVLVVSEYARELFGDVGAAVQIGRHLREHPRRRFQCYVGNFDRYLVGEADVDLLPAVETSFEYLVRDADWSPVGADGAVERRLRRSPSR
uniref:hypothetical protein n=1 Tax=Halostella limicola TaxID=2448456 RepID=UPI00196A09AA|nr:hypothetical protein [Halostella limicola]